MRLKLDSNFCDLLASFGACNVRYLIIGGWAVSVHAQPRATQDLDILVSSQRANIESVYEALLRFGAPLADIDKNDFLKPGTYFRLGMPPCQIDIFPDIPGVHFDECWHSRLEVPLETGTVASFISAEGLIAAKRASGREQDLADIRAIQRAQQQKPKN